MERNHNMGKNMYIYNVEDEFKDISPSCLGGFIHNIDYHYWRHNVKNMLPHKRNQARRAKGYGSPKARAIRHDSGEQALLLNADEKHLHVDKSNKVSAVTKKRSLKARIKAFIAHQSPKEGNAKKRGSKVSSRSQLQRTYSIHHREPEDLVLNEVCTDWEHPIIFFPGTNGTGATKLVDPTNTNEAEKPDACNEKFNALRNRDASKDKVKGHTDVLEILKVNKKLFLEILQNADDGIRKSSCALPPSKGKAIFTKSGSFPVADLLPRRNTEASKLKHKQTEVWSGPKGHKFPAATTLMPKDALKYATKIFSKSEPSMDNRTSTMLGRALSLILESTMESDKEGNREFSMPSKESEQEVQFEVIEDGNEDNFSSFSVLGEVPDGKECSRVKQDSPERCLGSTTNGNGDRSSCSSSETDEYDFKRSTFLHRRSASLNESLDKYVGLFENNFGKEVKLQSSKSLRLRKENEMGSGNNAPVLFTRIRSLSNLEHYSSLQNLVHGFVNFADWPITSVEETSSCTKNDCRDEIKEECIEPDDIEESGHQTVMLEKSDIIKSMDNVAGSREIISGECSAKLGDLIEDEFVVGKSISFREQESNNSMISHEVSTFEEFQSAEGWENFSEDLDEATSINFQSTLMPNLESIVNQDHIQNQGKSISVEKEDDDLDYVRDLLECSGFSKDATNWTWHSLDQPLGPSMFEEMEAYWHHEELEFSSDDSSNCYHHQLLFDLVNEELVHLHDRSSTYYPKALSSSCRIRPFPIANHMVKEICTSISTLKSFNPELKPSLDSVIDLDLRRDDCWMNLQLDSECLALELEDMIFGQLLQEVICS